MKTTNGKLGILCAELRDAKTFSEVEATFGAIVDFVEDVKNDTAQECYLQCLALEMGHGECAEAIVSKFNLKAYDQK